MVPRLCVASSLPLHEICHFGAPSQPGADQRDALAGWLGWPPALVAEHLPIQTSNGKGAADFFPSFFYFPFSSGSTWMTNNVLSSSRKWPQILSSFLGQLWIFKYMCVIFCFFLLSYTSDKQLPLQKRIEDDIIAQWNALVALALLVFLRAHSNFTEVGSISKPRMMDRWARFLLLLLPFWRYIRQQN